MEVLKSRRLIAGGVSRSSGRRMALMEMAREELRAMCTLPYKGDGHMCGHFVLG